MAMRRRPTQDYPTCSNDMCPLGTTVRQHQDIHASEEYLFSASQVRIARWDSYIQRVSCMFVVTEYNRWIQGYESSPCPSMGQAGRHRSSLIAVPSMGSRCHAPPNEYYTTGLARLALFSEPLPPLVWLLSSDVVIGLTYD